MGSKRSKRLKASIATYAPLVGTAVGTAFGAPQVGASIGNLASGILSKNDTQIGVAAMGFAQAAAQGELQALGIGPSGVFADIAKLTQAQGGQAAANRGEAGDASGKSFFQRFLEFLSKIFGR